MHAQNILHVGAYTKEESELEKGIIGADDCPQANKNEGMQTTSHAFRSAQWLKKSTESEYSKLSEL